MINYRRVQVYILLKRDELNHLMLTRLRAWYLAASGIT